MENAIYRNVSDFLDVSKMLCTFHISKVNSINQFSVAEWFRWWANPGVNSPLSDWEVVGSNPTAGMSRIGFFMQGRHFNVQIGVCFPRDQRILVVFFA